MPCADGTDRPHLPFDAASATGALPQVLDAVEGFLPWYPSADHGTGYKAQASILAYESARLTALAFAGRGPDSGDAAVICQNATAAIHRPACQLKLGSGDVVVGPTAGARGCGSAPDLALCSPVASFDCRACRWLPALILHG